MRKMEGAKFVGELPGPGPWTMTRYGSGRDAVIVLTSPTAPAMMLVDGLLVSMDLSGVEAPQPRPVGTAE